MRWICLVAVVALTLTRTQRSFGSDLPRRSEETSALVGKAIKAAGGTKILREIKGARGQAQATCWVDGVPCLKLSSRFYYTAPDKFRIDMTIAPSQALRSETHAAPGNVDRLVFVLNGQSGWGRSESSGNQVRIMDDEGKQMVKEWLYQLRLTLDPTSLQERGLTVTNLGGHKLRGEAAHGVLVSRPGYGDARFFFDDARGRLFERITWEDPLLGKEKILVHCAFRDYRVADGVTFPSTWTFTCGGCKLRELTITELRFFKTPLEERLFSRR